MRQLGTWSGDPPPPRHPIPPFFCCCFCFLCLVIKCGQLLGPDGQVAVDADSWCSINYAMSDWNRKSLRNSATCPFQLIGRREESWPLTTYNLHISLIFQCIIKNAFNANRKILKALFLINCFMRHEPCGRIANCCGHGILLMAI